MRTRISKKGKLKFGPSKEKQENPEDNIPKNVKEALKDFPLPLTKDFFSKKDLRNIRKYRISYGDIFNADGHIYFQLALTIHVYEKFSIGVPGDYRADTIPLDYDTSNGGVYVDKNLDDRFEAYSRDLKQLRDDFIWLHENDTYSTPFDEDNYDKEELKRPTKKELKNGASLFGGYTNKEKQAKRKEMNEKHSERYEETRKRAFLQLSEMVDGMWV